MISGGCHCGAITYKVSGKVSDIVHCHCVTCRKAHGSAFSSVVSVPLDGFELQGESHLGCYESSPGKQRYFCRTCGAPLYAKRDEKQNITLSLGSLDTNIPSKEFAHIWISDGASWYELNAELPLYEKSWRDGN